MNNNDKKVIVIIIGSIFTLLSTFFIGEKIGEEAVKQCLVNQGFADWYSDDSRAPYWKIHIK